MRIHGHFEVFVIMLKRTAVSHDQINLAVQAITMQSRRTDITTPHHLGVYTNEKAYWLFFYIEFYQNIVPIMYFGIQM